MYVTMYIWLWKCHHVGLFMYLSEFCYYIIEKRCYCNSVMPNTVRASHAYLFLSVLSRLSLNGFCSLSSDCSLLFSPSSFSSWFYRKKFWSLRVCLITEWMCRFQVHVWAFFCDQVSKLQKQKASSLLLTRSPMHVKDRSCRCQI